MADRSKNLSENLSHRIKTLRKQKKYTQKDLAKLLYKSESTVRMWELGKSEPDIETIIKIAHFLEVSVEQLLGLDGRYRSELSEPEQVALEVADRLQEDMYPSLLPLTEQEKTLLTVFRETTEEGRMEMIAAIVNIKKDIEAKRTAPTSATLA